MRYNLTDKLNFNDDPEIEVKGEVFTVRSDATTVLKVMALAKEKDEVEALIECAPLLFSEKDQKTIKKMNLKMDDYITFMQVALSLALGEDPDEESQPGGENRTTI